MVRLNVLRLFEWPRRRKTRMWIYNTGSQQGTKGWSWSWSERSV